MSRPLLEAAHVSCRYGPVPVLHDVSLEIPEGSFTALVGPNGAGKTTLLHCLLGLVRGARGTITVQGRPVEVWDRRALARVLAWVPQTPVHPPGFDVRTFVGMGRYPHNQARRLDFAQDRGAVEWALAVTGTAGLAGRPIDRLSGGERQLVYLAAALAQEPRVLLLDEPAACLDPRHQEDVHGLLRRLHRAGMTILAATHDLNRAVLSAGRVVALHGGRVLYDGPPSGLMDSALLQRMYGAPFTLVSHPAVGVPMILPGGATS